MPLRGSGEGSSRGLSISVDAQDDLDGGIISSGCGAFSRLMSSLLVDDEEQVDLEIQSAEIIQRWWRSVNGVEKTAKWMLRVRPAFERVDDLLSEIERTPRTVSFEDASKAVQDKCLHQAVATALAALPRDEVLQALPRIARSTHAFLSAVMITYFESDVLGTGDGTDEQSDTQRVYSVVEGTHGHTTSENDQTAAILLNASALVLASAKAVKEAICGLGELENGSGVQQVLKVRLGALRFSRRYFAVSLLQWKAADAERVAAQLVQPYARGYATKQAAMARGADCLANMVQEQLDLYRKDLERLIGADRAYHTLQEVELAVEADLSSNMDVDITDLHRQDSFRHLSLSPRPNTAPPAGDAPPPPPPPPPSSSQLLLSSSEGVTALSLS
ncbi:unnamed protein product, partial [Discosporangium mesarthrocarpum]